MIKKSIEFSNLKHGTKVTQIELAKHLEKEGHGKAKNLVVAFSLLNKGKQDGMRLGLLYEVSKYLKISADVLLGFRVK